ncbi:MAG: NAD(P)-dependent alcohol dehydrogenase [Microbacteriaceae bacterium]
MTTSRVLSVASPTAKFEKTTLDRGEVGDNEVLIDIAFSGICHSDLHQARNEWFEGIFPMVPGHEIAGHVAAIGSKVTKFKVGDAVGVGTIIGSCGVCEYCQAGRQNVCLKGNVQTYNGRFYDGRPTFGGYSNTIIVDENFVLSLPAGLPMDAAAPLLCAGITVFAPLKRYGATSGKRVAIMGMGGLGHLGVKFAAAFGAETYVLGTSAAKASDAAEFGAAGYILINDEATFEKYTNFFDIILNTTSSNIAVDKILTLLRVGGSLVNVGLPPEDEHFNPFSLIASMKSISGSNTGGIAETQDMLNFCAEHNITATVEVVDATEAGAIDAAYDRMLHSDVRYRFVIDASTI